MTLDVQLNGQLKGQVFRGGGSVSFPAGFYEVFPVHPDRRKGSAERCRQEGRQEGRQEPNEPTKRKETGADREASKDRKRGPDEVG